MEMIRHTVEFRSPGSFLAESDFVTIWGFTKASVIKKAMEKAKKIVQRYNAIPYAFLLGKVWYYLPHCEVEFASSIANTPENRILISNCLSNGFKAIVTTKKGWKFTQPFTKNCVLLDKKGEIKMRGSDL